MYTSVQITKPFSVTAMYTAFKMKYDSNYSFAGEFHNFWEIVFVLDGKLGVTAGSNMHILSEGQAIIHPPMEFHSLWSEEGTTPTVVVFSFTADNVPAIQSKIVLFDNLYKPVEILTQMRSAFVMEKQANFVGIKNPNEVSHQLVIKDLEKFLLTLISKSTAIDNVLQTRSAQHFSKAVNIMEKNLDKDLSVKDIATLCNIGEVSLKKIFSKYLGMGVMTYFTKMKITSGIQMLKSGMNVSETASALGFSNQNYFSTVFKRVTGHPPSYYK